MNTIQGAVRSDPQFGSNIEQRARALIDANHYFVGMPKQFEFLFKDDILVVRGNVTSFYLKQLVQTSLKELEGVCRIDIQIKVLRS